MPLSHASVRRHLIPFLFTAYREAAEAPKSQADERILPLCEELLAAPPGEVRAFFANPGGGPAESAGRFWTRGRDDLHTHFAVYSSRAPWLSLEERSGPRLLSGLLASALIHDSSDWRDLLVSLAPSHHCAKVLELDVPALFERAGRYAGEQEEHYVTFGRRTDVSLAAFGWAEVQTPHGMRFRQTQWRPPARRP